MKTLIVALGFIGLLINPTMGFEANYYKSGPGVQAHDVLELGQIIEPSEKLVESFDYWIQVELDPVKVQSELVLFFYKAGGDVWQMNEDTVFQIFTLKREKSSSYFYKNSFHKEVFRSQKLGYPTNQVVPILQRAHVKTQLFIKINKALHTQFSGMRWTSVDILPKEQFLSQERAELVKYSLYLGYTVVMILLTCFIIIKRLMKGTLFYLLLCVANVLFISGYFPLGALLVEDLFIPHNLFLPIGLVMGSFYLTKFFEIKSVIVKAVQITELIIIVFMAFHFIQNGISKPYNTLLAILNYANLIFILGFITFLVIRGKSTVKKWLLTGIISQTILGVVGALILTGIINISWLNAYDTTLLGLFVEQGFFLFAAFTLLMNEKKEKIEVKKQNQILERTLVHNQEDLHDLQNRLTEFGKQASLMNIERIETNERLNNSALMNVLEEADEQFQASLLKLTPRLTVNEMRILQYMRIGLTNQEIAEANNISLDSLYVFRSRLKKKLSLEKNEKLEDFVLSIKSLKTTT